MLTNGTDKRLRSSRKSVNFHYRCDASNGMLYQNGISLVKKAKICCIN